MPHNHGVAPWSGEFYSSSHSLPQDVAMKNNTVDSQMGMWGIVLKPTQRTRVAFDRPFALKQAVLDSNSFIKQDFHFRVMLVDNKDDQSPLTLCILNKQTLNAALDVEFQEGDDVTFYVKTDSFNKDLNSFSVSLSGKSVRSDAFEGRPSAASPRKITELNHKNRSASLPDEYYQPKTCVPSPLAKTPPADWPNASSADKSAESPTSILLRAESLHEDGPDPNNSENPESTNKSAKRSRSYKGSFKGGDVLGKLGKYLSKS